MTKSTERYLIIGVIAALGIILIAVGRNVLRSPLDLRVIQRERTALERDKIAMERRNLERNDHLALAAIAAVLGSVCASGLIVAAGFHRAHVIRASVFMLEIGKHTKVPVHIRHLKNNALAQERMVLAASEELRQLNAGRDKAVDALERIIAADAQHARAHRQPSAHLPRLQEAAALPAAIPDAPSFAQMLQHGIFQPGADLVFGFDRAGEPQRRKLEDVKALSVAGWQGSGKTLSTGYLVASILLTAPDSEAYVIDPHGEHPDGLGKLLEPLEETGRLHRVNPAEASGLIRALNALLDKRLSGEESSEPQIVLVVEEMNRIGRTALFQDELLPFLDRCTEEIRKAGMVFIGCGQKWQAKFFGGSAAIRQSIPSVLVHKMKPSQAGLLLEDNAEKRMVKHLTRPGQALLCTSHDADPMPVQMPLITKSDVRHISQHVIKKQVNGPLVDYTIDLSVDSENTGKGGFVDCRAKLDHYCQTRGNFSRMVKELGIDQGYLSRIRSGRQEPSTEWEQKIETYLSKQQLHVIKGGKS